MALIEFEKRSVQTIQDLPNWDRYFSDNSQSASKVNRQTAQKLAAVYACQDAISSDLAGLPIQLKQRVGSNVNTISDNPIVDKIKTNPNNEMNPFIFRQTRQLNVLNAGNAYVLIEKSPLNPVKNLWLLDPDSVTPFRTKTTNGRRGIIQYSVVDGYGRPKIYTSSEIMHLKGPSWNGIIGESVITSNAREVLGIGLDMDKFISNFFQKGMNPGGVLTHPASLGENKEGFIAALKKRYAGNQNSKAPMVLEDGMEFKPYDVKMVDQQFLEMMKLNKTDICGMFGVPQSRISIADSNTNYNNTEQENRRYIMSGLIKYAIQDEQEMNFKLLTDQERKDGFFWKYNFNALLRGDAKTQAELSEIWGRQGVPVNVSLALEDRNPVEGGDVGLVQMNMIPITDVGANFETPVDTENNNRSLNEPEYRDIKKTIAHRERVKKRFSPLIREAAQKLANRESVAIRKETKKQSSERSVEDMERWLNNFYRDFGKYIDKDLAPILRAYAESIQEAAAGEIGAEIGVSDELRAEINNYIDGFKNQYIDSSRRQMLSQLEIGFDKIDKRAEEWHEKKAGKVEAQESNGLSNMVAAFVFTSSGFPSVWRNVGPTCPFCQTMNGKKVNGFGTPFLAKYTTIDVGGDHPPMTVRTTKYPPLHKGCDCVISAR